MKATERCEANYQGDRCKDSKGHGDSHVGNFTAWDRVDAPMSLYPIEHRRNRLELRQERQSGNWIKQVTKMVRLGALASEYVRSFMKNPEGK